METLERRGEERPDEGDPQARACRPLRSRQPWSALSALASPSQPWSVLISGQCSPRAGPIITCERLVVYSSSILVRH